MPGYMDNYPESEANSVIRGMDMTGHADFARRGLEFYLRQCNAAGFITILINFLIIAFILFQLVKVSNRMKRAEPPPPPPGPTKTEELLAGILAEMKKK